MYNGVKQGGVISCHSFNLYIDTACTDYVDCIVQKSHFIGYVSKLKVNFGKNDT